MKSNRRNFLKGTGAALGALPVLADEPIAAHPTTPSTPTSTALVIDDDASISVTLSVNHAAHSVAVRPLDSLATVLRERLKLTGTKVSCEAGACGACTVLVDGVARNACTTLAIDVEHAEISTVEGLADGATLSAVQQAFVDADALQCGFCTPGMIMAATAFVAHARSATRVGPILDDDIRRGMAGNICRCGAHPNILEAVRAVVDGRKAVPPGGVHAVGTSARIDAVEKVTGRAKYSIDEMPEGALVGHIVRAPMGRARLISMELSKAASSPGVHAVIRLIPVDDKGVGHVRYAGQELFAIAATTTENARRAARAAELVWERQTPLVDPVLAANATDDPIFAAPKDVPVAAEGLVLPSFLSSWEGNIRRPGILDSFADSSRARKAVTSAPISTRLFAQTATQVHASLERHVALAQWDDGALTLTTGTQLLQGVAKDLAAYFEIPVSKVRVVSRYVGGAFGAKAGLKPYQIAAARLAKETQKPVRIVLSMAEHLTVGGNRPATSHIVAIGASEEGRLDSVVHEGRSFCGAASGEKSTGMTADHYAFAHTAIVDENVVTNAPPSCPFRAPGFPPNAFALEQAVDDVAVKTNKNPLVMRIDQEQRRRFRLVYRAALKRSGFEDRLTDVGRDKGRFARGVGVATSHWAVITAPNATVEIRAHRDGHVELRTATHEMGQGPRSVMAELVASHLKLPRDHIRVETGDSQFPTAPGSFGSITTTSIAPATVNAINSLKEHLLQGGRRVHKGGRPSPDGLLLDDERVIPWRELFAAMAAEPFTASGVRGADLDGFALPPKMFDPFADDLPFALGKDVVSSATLVEVEVDRRLGRVRPMRAFCALDAGRIMSPLTARSQVIGGVLQGISFALYEERRLEAVNGLTLSASFESYAVLGVGDAPAVDVVFLDAPSPNNPVGALGLGENCTVAAAGAVANAVYRAIGRRISQTPITPSKVLEVSK